LLPRRLAVPRDGTRYPAGRDVGCPAPGSIPPGSADWWGGRPGCRPTLSRAGREGALGGPGGPAEIDGSPTRGAPTREGPRRCHLLAPLGRSVTWSSSVISCATAAARIVRCVMREVW